MGEGGDVRKRKLRDSPIGQFKLEGCWMCSCQMVSAFPVGSSDPFSSVVQGHCFVFLGKTPHSPSAPLQDPWVLSTAIVNRVSKRSWLLVKIAIAIKYVVRGGFWGSGSLFQAYS